jgi:hypothetical protein
MSLPRDCRLHGLSKQVTLFPFDVFLKRFKRMCGAWFGNVKHDYEGKIASLAKNKWICFDNERAVMDNVQGL